MSPCEQITRGHSLLKTLLLITSYLFSTYGADLTRSYGLVNYPESRDFNSPGSHDDYNSSIMPAKIRITLTRNIGNLNSSKLMAPDVSYFGAVGVGSPSKMFNVMFDTGSSQIWLPYYNWFPFANNLHYSDGYSCKDSSTCVAYKKNFNLDYRNTNLTGETYEDVFTIYEDMQKDNAIVLVSRHLSFGQNFLAIEDAGDEQFRYKPYDGVIGLAPVAQSGSGTRNILVSLQREQQRQMAEVFSQANMGPSFSQDGINDYYRPRNMVTNLVFSFWFNPNENSRHGGELMLGGVDENRYSGDIYFHRVSSWFDWQLPMAYVMLGGRVISCANGCQAILDTGVNSLLGPRRDVEEIYNEIQAQYNHDSDLWLVDCNKLDQYPTLIFKLDDIPYNLFPAHYIKLFKFRESIICHLAIKPWGNQGWLLGTSFIGAYYTVFDFANRRVGFATPRNYNE